MGKTWFVVYLKDGKIFRYQRRSRAQKLVNMHIIPLNSSLVLLVTFELFLFSILNGNRQQKVGTAVAARTGKPRPLYYICILCRRLSFVT